MKILVLFDLSRKTSPDERFSARALRRDEEKPTEADVLLCLRRLEHEVETLAVFDNVNHIVDTITAWKPDVVFNLCESFLDDRAHEPNIPALLELMKVPYTGAGPEALMLCKDKALAKKLLHFHRVRVAGFVVSHPEQPLRKLRRFAFPAFVKPIAEESSDGISKASFAKNEDEAIERARFIHEKLGCAALIEEYIDGRELYVGLLGNKRPVVLPTREIFFGGAGEEEPDPGAPRFATAKAKWDEAYRKKWGIRNGPAAELPEGVEEKLAKIARRVYKTLKITSLGRIDVRLTASNDIIVMEANPNPSLARDEDFAMAAGAAGIEYDALIQRILENAVREVA
jgi:D-alanine-D-alanine ligase